MPPRSRGPTQTHSAGILVNKLRNFKRLFAKPNNKDIADTDHEYLQYLNGLYKMYLLKSLLKKNTLIIE